MSRPKQNLTTLDYCDEKTSFHQVKTSTQNFLKWTLANPSLVQPFFFKNDKITDELKFFDLSIDFDVDSLKLDPDFDYIEFQDKWDNSSILKICFCNRQYTRKDITDSEIGSFCNFNLNPLSKIFMIIVVSGSLITLANLLILQIVPFLITQIPMENVTSRQNLTVLVTLIFMYINSILAPILIHTEGFLNTNNDYNGTESLFSKLIIFYDFDHEWYQEVGLKITISFIFNVIICSVGEFIRVKIDYR
jgi:hypothetical protein